MTNDPRTDDLDARLLETLRREVADDGFTSRVASTVPRRRRPRDWTGPLVAAGALAGCALATFALPVGPALMAGWRDLASAGALTPAALGAIVATMSLAASAAVVAADS